MGLLDGNVDPYGWLLDNLNSRPGEVTVQPGKLTAKTDKDAANQALGKPLPIVVGTGRVDGVYFIGGVQQQDTVTTTKTWTSQDITEYGGGIFADQVIRGGNVTGTGGSILFGDVLPIYTAVTSQTVTTETTTKAGYLLAYDYFEVGYDLIRIEIDGKCVYDGEQGIPASATFRFYGGQHTAADPILTEIIGANAGAYKNFVMLFLDGYPAGSAPSISCVISNGVTDQQEEAPIVWTGATPATMDEGTAGRHAAYDPASGVVYQLLDYRGIPSTTAVYLAVLDSNTYLERYRVPLAGSASWLSYPVKFLWNMRGTGHVIVRAGPAGGQQTQRVFDVATGALVASFEEELGVNTYVWHLGAPFGSKYMMVGNDFIGTPSTVYGIIDITAGTFEAGEVPGLAFNDFMTFGRPSGAIGGSPLSFFFCDGSVVREATFNGDSWTVATRYTSAGIVVTAIWFDTLTGYLVVAEIASLGVYRIIYINPDTGALIDSFSINTPLYIESVVLLDGRERLWPNPGYVMLTEDAFDPARVYLLDVVAQTMVIYAENPDLFYTQQAFSTGIFDQTKRIYITGIYDDVWTVHSLPNSAPLLLDLQDVVTDVMSLAGFTSGDLTFEGFSGIQTWGFVIASDTTIQSAVRPLADTYGFSWCDTGSGFFFKKAAQDGLFAIDAAFTTADIVERPQPVQSSDEANIRTPSSVEMEYQSKEGPYKARPASFNMTTGVLNSITTPKFSTPILLSDAEAQRIVTEKFFEYQEKRRTHSLVVAPENIEVLPGDIVSFPSGLITYIARVEQIGIDLRNMGVEISAKDFQTEVETTITAVTNTAPVSRAVFFTSQYVHLDMPLFRYVDDTGGTSLVQYGVVAPRGQEFWSGGTLYSGAVVTALTALFNQAPHQGVVGICTTGFNAPVDPFALDDASTVTIRRVTHDASLLVDATEDEVLAGKNNALIGIDGRWEWVGFKTVVDNLDGTYTLSGFTLRGYRGSEVFCGDHEIGDVFVTINQTWLKKSIHPLTDLGDTLYYKAAGLGQNPANVTIKPHVISGAAETPYAPINLAASVSSPDGIDIAWDYRSRLTTGTNPAGSGELTLAFQIDIYDTDGVTYIRTLTATTNFVHYASADVVTDFGSDPPSELFFRVYMMSALPILVPGQDRAVAGRGYEGSGHVNFTGAGEPIGLLLALTRS